MSICPNLNYFSSSGDLPVLYGGEHGFYHGYYLGDVREPLSSWQTSEMAQEHDV